MRADGVTETQAKAMYGAVYYLGPRWGVGTAGRGPGAQKGLTAAQEDKFFADLEVWTAKNNPSLEEIAKKVESGAI